MEWDVFKKLVDDTRGMGITYRPYVLGEPLVDKRMPDILEYIKLDPTAKVEIHTNGEPLTEALENKISHNIDIIRFSVDGIRLSTFAKTRKIDRDKVYRNINRFITNNPTVPTEVRMIDLPGTEAEQRHFKRYWGKYAVITALYDDPWTNQKESTNEPCYKSQHEAFVYVDGSIHPCPWDPDMREVIGNVADGVVNVWKSWRYQQIREWLAEGRRDNISLCSRCSYFKEHT